MLLALGCVLPFLVSPRVPPGSPAASCVHVVDILGPIHVNVNCDSYEFLLLARNPARLLSEHNTWQSRPGYAVIGWLLAQPIKALHIKRDSVAEYGAYLSLNWMLLSASILLFGWLCGDRPLLRPSLLFPLVILVCNEVSKAFFWTPHLQIFNIFMPMMSVSLGYWLLSRNQPLRWQYALFIGFLLGLGSLVYGAFVVTMVSAILCIWFREHLVRGSNRLWRNVISSTLLGSAFVAPVVSWICFVVLNTGSFYSHEIVAYRQFVWLHDFWCMGYSAFTKKLVVNLLVFVHTIRSVAILPALLLVITVAISTCMRVSPCSSERKKKIHRAVILYLLAAVPFYALMGFYATRLTWTIVPPILVLSAFELERLVGHFQGNRRVLVMLFLYGSTLSYIMYWYVKSGPYI